jgi:hypothetical protein
MGSTLVETEPVHAALLERRELVGGGLTFSKFFQGHPVAQHCKAAGITGFDLGLTKDKGSFHEVFRILLTVQLN